MTTTDHRTRVSPRNGEYVINCAICGPVGHPEELQGDAEAIAERHAEIGGFER